MKPINHPLDDVFNVDSNSVDIEKEYSMQNVPVNATPTEAQPDIKDEDDILIEQRIDEVYTAAIDAFNNQTSYMEIIEPRYAARNAEVAANYLNIALAAATSRSKVKVDRKRANQSFVPHTPGGRTTNNIIVANREEILKMITIDNEKKEM